MSHFLSSLFSVPKPLADVFGSIFKVWGYVWWFVLPVVTGIMAWEAWKVYLHWRFIKRLNLKLLEIKIPKNVLKTPKAMEQIFAAAHAPYSYGYRWTDKYWKGLEEYWMSFELVGRAGETHFYLRVPSEFRHMMESAIYSQFPEAEITEADDYLKSMPKIVPNKDLDLNGFEEILQYENYRPIRTYPLFEDPVEERRVDTMGGIMEVMSKMRGDQQLWMQLILVPAGEDNRLEGEKAISKILGIETKDEKKGGIWPDLDIGISLGEAIFAPFQHPGPAKEKKEEKDQFKHLRFLVAPHDKERADLIQEKIAKLSFDTTLRFIMIEPRNMQKAEHVMSVHGFIRQFHLQGSNQLKPDKATTTAGYAVRGLFKQTRLHWRKRLLYEHYYHTLPAHHKPILNTEELATVFHFPTMTVTTSELEKVESRKGTPPATLPIVE